MTSHPTVEGMFVSRDKRTAEICDAMAARTTGATSALWAEYAGDARLRHDSMLAYPERDAHLENDNRNRHQR